jgi:trimeric autotransporter adhesin
MRLSSYASFCGLIVVTSALLGCGASATPPVSAVGSEIQGKVHGGQQPVTGANIQAYAVGTTGDGSPATPLSGGSAVTDSAGNFSLALTCQTANPEVYLVATGGNPGLAPGTDNTAISLMAALGPCSQLNSSTFVVINEATTIASVNVLLPYMNSYSTVGSSSSEASSLAAQFSLVNQFISTTTGTSPGPALPAYDNVSTAKLYTLSDIVAECINSAGGIAGDGSACGSLFTFATPSGGTVPTETIGAVIDIATMPYTNVAGLFALAPPNGPFQPTLSSAPIDWTLPINPSPDGSPLEVEAFSATGGLVIIPFSAQEAGGFAVATDFTGTSPVNQAIVSLNTGGNPLPLSALICQTNPSNGQCLAPPSASMQLSIAPGDTPTFSVFLTAYAAIANNPLANRVYVVFEDCCGNTIGSTSIAVDTN